MSWGGEGEELVVCDPMSPVQSKRSFASLLSSVSPSVQRAVQALDRTLPPVPSPSIPPSTSPLRHASPVQTARPAVVQRGGQTPSPQHPGPQPLQWDRSPSPSGPPPPGGRWSGGRGERGRRSGKRWSREDAAARIQALVRGHAERRRVRAMEERRRILRARNQAMEARKLQSHVEQMDDLFEAERQRRRASLRARRMELVSVESIRVKEQRLMRLKDRCLLRKGDMAVRCLQRRIRAYLEAKRGEEQAELIAAAARAAIDHAHPRLSLHASHSSLSSLQSPSRPPPTPGTSGPSVASADAARDEAQDGGEEDGGLGGDARPDAAWVGMVKRHQADRAASVVAALFRGRIVREKLRRIRRIAWRAKMRVPNRERLELLFRAVDLNGDGSLSAQEWLHAHGKSKTPEWYVPSDDDDDDGEDRFAPPGLHGKAANLKGGSKEEEEEDEEEEDGGDEEEGEEEETIAPLMNARDMRLPVAVAPPPPMAKPASPRPPPPPPKLKSAGLAPKMTGKGRAKEAPPTVRRATTGSSKATLHRKMPATEHMRVFRAIDTDESGQVDLEEFVAFFLKTKNDAMLDWMQTQLVQLLEPEKWASAEQRAREAAIRETAERQERERREYFRECARRLFRLADTDHSGSITPLELRRAFSAGPFSHPLTADDSRALQIFRLFDVDRSGSIEEHELVETFANDVLLPSDLRSWLEAQFGPPQ
jgi:Ca2+-binding EF-hand superfamily protein